MAPTSQVTTFSDNVAISFPIKRMEHLGHVSGEEHMFYTEASKFFEHLLLQIIIAVWDGLKIGVLFRGAITIGRLTHDNEIIAGEALVTAAKMEKATKHPRIELSPEILTMVDSHNDPIVSDFVKESCLEEVDGRWFVKTLDYHLGSWIDHGESRIQRGEVAESILDALEKIRFCLKKEFSVIQENGSKPAVEKWEWFMPEFEKALQSGVWEEMFDRLKDKSNRH